MRPAGPDHKAAPRTPDGSGPSSDTAAELSRLRSEVMAAQASLQTLRRRVVELKSAEQTARTLRRENSLLEARYQDAARALTAVQASASWKLTRPVRGASRLISHLLKGLDAWIKFTPGSRPHRIASRFLPRLASMATAAPGDVEGTSPADGTKYAFRYLFLDSAATPGEARLARRFGRALIQAGHAVRYVRWDKTLEACVLVDADRRNLLARGDGPALADHEIGAYPQADDPGLPLAPPLNSGAWVYLCGAGPEAAQAIGWVHRLGLRAGAVVFDGATAEHLAALDKADHVWTSTPTAAQAVRAAFAGGGRRPQPQVLGAPAFAVRQRPLAAPATDNFILCIGAGQDYPAHMALIQVFQEVLEQRPGCKWRLLLAGAFDPALSRHLSFANSPGSPVEFLSEVSDSELDVLYEWCAFTVDPCAGEGAVFPMWDSHWHGRPMVCDAGEIPAGQGGCLAIDASDREQLKAALGRLIDDSAFLRELSQQALEQPLAHWSEFVQSVEASGPGAEPLIYYWVDSTVMVPVNTGIQRVVRQLARGLIEAGYRVVPVKWGGIDEPLRPVTERELRHFALWNGPVADRWAGWVAPRAHQGGGWFIMGELPHNLSVGEQQAFRREAEAAGLNTAAVFYDTIPWKMPGLYPPSFSEAHLSYMRELFNYTRVLAISDYSRREMISVLADEFQVPEEQTAHLLAAPLAAEFPEALDQSAAEPLQEGVIEILCVGTVEPRKNHERLLDAFELASQRSAVPLHLTIVGGSHSFEPDLAVRVRARIDANPCIDWEQKADDARIKQLYLRCAFTSYPSVEEGFGMPILESLWYGKPAICADFGAMAEVAEGGGCVMVNVRDVGAMAQAMVTLANDPARLAELVREAKSRVFRSWKDYTLDAVQILELPSVPVGGGLTRVGPQAEA